MMHQMMGLAHIFTASRIDQNSALMDFKSLTVSDIQFKDKHLGDQNKTNDDLRAHLEKFLDRYKISLGIITDQIDVTMRSIINPNANVSKVCPACRVHSECIMEIKRDTANRSGSSIIGDVVEKFLMSIILNQSKKAPICSTATNTQRLVGLS